MFVDDVLMLDLRHKLVNVQTYVNAAKVVALITPVEECQKMLEDAITQGELSELALLDIIKDCFKIIKPKEVDAVVLVSNMDKVTK